MRALLLSIEPPKTRIKAKKKKEKKNGGREEGVLLRFGV
jgi:hypothetical protein